MSEWPELDPEMERLRTNYLQAHSRAIRAVNLARSAEAESHKQLRAWEAVVRARGLDPDSYPGMPPWPCYIAERRWPDFPGTAKTKVEILDREEMGLMVGLDLVWIGDYDSPDQRHVYWEHFIDHLGRVLFDYLLNFSPAPTELITTLRNSLPPELRKAFDGEVDGGSEP
jgi:hypothetical protein